MKNAPFIPFHVPSIGEEEIKEVEATLRSGWLTTGPRAAQFERELGAYVDARHAIAVNSATAGLHLALAALGIGAGDEVITTPLTFCATVQAILHVGATPVLADIGADGNIDPDAIEKRITKRTRAVIPVHLAGLPCEMSAIRDLGKRKGIYVIEDAAHAVGAHYEGRPIGGASSGSGRASAAVVFSFYATKNLTTGEGGMITTERQELADNLRVLALHGTSHDAWDRYKEHGNWYYEVVAHGFKYNLSDVHAALGIHQVRKLENFIETRTRYARQYNHAFADVEEVELPPDHPHCRHAWHLYILRLRVERLRIDRAEFIEQLRAKGIGSSVHFIPIPMHPFFARLPLARHACPRALELYPRIVSLPLYPAMTEEQVDYVAQSVREIIQGARQTRYFASGSRPAQSPMRLTAEIETETTT